MPKITEIDVEFTDTAIERFTQFLSRITDYTPTLCLLKGHPENEPEERWIYGAYGPENIQALSPEFEKLGYGLLYKISGMVVAISMPDRIPELLGKTIDVGEKGLVLRNRGNGI